jgi:hypothetical protein
MVSQGSEKVKKEFGGTGFGLFLLKKGLKNPKKERIITLCTCLK